MNFPKVDDPPRLTTAGESSTTPTSSQAELDELHAQAVRDFVHLHKNPELSGRELITTQYISDRIATLGLPLMPYATPGIVTQVNAARADAPLVIMRADIDALPVAESPENTYVSTVPGISHACGHDGHMAINLAAMEWALRHKHELPCSIRFVFQSSEEMIPSGAETLVNQGVLDDVDHVFGLHLWQGLESGKIGLTRGPMMASTDDFEIVLEGPGGHGALPHMSADVIVAASSLVMNLQTVVSRNSDPLRPVVVTVGDLQARGNYNVLPAEARLRGTVRTLDESDRSRIANQIRSMVSSIASSHGVATSLNYIHGTPPLINDERCAEFIHTAVTKHVSTAAAHWVDPTMGGEDFSFYLQHRPGSFAFVGMGGPTYTAAHHTPRFEVDPKALRTGIETLIAIIREYEDL